MHLTDLSDDYDEIIHYDARNGNLISLKAYLEHKPECINKVYQFNQSKWTVLLAACFYQHEEMVKMLINHFKADVEANGTVLLDRVSGFSQIVENASALWIAAAVNNINIVKFLVEYGLANVNHITKELSTPVRAACYHGNLEMVQYLIHHGANPHQKRLKDETNLMLIVYRQHIDLVIYFVNEIKCDLNQQNESGETALHVAIELSSTEITKLLISGGALNLYDKSRNMTPLMLAAINGKSDLVSAFDGHCSELEWIEAKELLASTFAGCESGIEDLNLAAEYLTLAFEARLAKNLPKFLRAQALDNRRECETVQDLNQLVSSGSREAFYIEALLIRERLLGTTSKIYHNSLRRVGKTLARTHQYAACLRLWFYELNLRRQHGILFNRHDLRSFAILFDNMLSMDLAQAFIDDLCKMLIIMNEELSLMQNSEDINYNLVTLLYLITISGRVLLSEEGQEVSVTDRKVLHKHIRSIVEKKYVTTGSRSSLLHLCCNENTKRLNSLTSHPCVLTTRLLVICGIDVDMMDSARNTALHILVQNREEQDDTMIVIDYLCDHGGAHMDIADNKGNRPIDFRDENPYLNRSMLRRLQQKMGVTSLKCRCARLIKQGRVPYQKYLSSSLVNFVYKH